MDIRMEQNGYRLVLNTKGAELLSYKDPDGVEYMWQGDPLYFLNHAPILFPSIGNLRNNETTIKGKLYRMPKHGFARNMEFAITEQTADHCCLLLQDSDETKKMFPYAFTLALTYQLYGSRLVTTITVSNQDVSDMPYHIGISPTFNCPFSDESNFKFKDYEIAFEKIEELRSTTYDTKRLCFSSRLFKIYSKRSRGFRLKHSLFDEDVLYFAHLNSRRISLRSLVSDKQVTMYYPDFNGLALWTTPGMQLPFLSLQAWNGSAVFDTDPKEFEKKKGIEILGPGESKSYRMELFLE